MTSLGIPFSDRNCAHLPGDGPERVIGDSHVASKEAVGRVHRRLLTKSLEIRSQRLSLLQSGKARHL